MIIVYSTEEEVVEEIEMPITYPKYSGNSLPELKICVQLNLLCSSTAVSAKYIRVLY